MPAPRKLGTRDSGLPIITARRIDNTISIEKYYRSAELLVRQVGIVLPQLLDAKFNTISPISTNNRLGLYRPVTTERGTMTYSCTPCSFGWQGGHLVCLFLYSHHELQ